MDCDIALISCQLERIADEMTRFDWNGFAATLMATLVGAVVAAVISIVLYRHEASTRRQGEVDDAVVTLIREIQIHSSRTREWYHALQNYRAQASSRLITGTGGQVALPPIAPDRSGIDTAVEALIVLTDGDDRRVADRARQVLYELTFIGDGDLESNEHSSVRRVLVSWRAQKRSAAETLASLDVIDGRREQLEGGAMPESLQPDPEPYERTTSKSVTSN